MTTITRYGYKDPRAAYGDFQNSKYAPDAPSLDADLFNRLASLLNDTIAKGAPRAQDTPDMTIYVPAFQAYINGALVSFAGGSTGTMTAPSANPRIDRVYLTDAGALAITTGAEAGSPTAPALVAGTVPICLVYHRVGSVHIDDADDSTNSYIYRDDRPFYQGVGASGSVSAEVPYDDADGEVTLLTMPGNGFIRFVGKVVTTAYDDGSVTLGKEGDESCLMSAALVDAQGATNDTYTPNKYYASGSVIKAFITPGLATEGTFTLILEYVTV
ncbi:MAG: hypothetical protein WC912_08965 [Thermovirgaceae bacterium]